MPAGYVVALRVRSELCRTSSCGFSQVRTRNGVYEHVLSLLELVQLASGHARLIYSMDLSYVP